MQMEVSWALGKEVFGIKPVKPLKSLLIQVEMTLETFLKSFVERWADWG